jgi:hypothetical protein
MCMSVKLGRLQIYLRQGSVSLRRLVPGQARTVTQTRIVTILIPAASRDLYVRGQASDDRPRPCY